MTESEKRELFATEMLSRGAKKSGLRPPLFRLLWTLGSRVPPPLYATGGQQFLVHGLMAGAFWGTFMWILVWRDSPGVAVGGGFLFGLLFSLMMHFQIERRRKKLGIEGDWGGYQPNQTTNAEQVTDDQLPARPESKAE